MPDVTEHYEQLLAEHYTWMLGADLTALATRQAQLLSDLGTIPGPAGTLAVDLGCGPGTQTLALTELGFTPVVAVDTSQTLLDELADHAGPDAAIRTVNADLRTVLPTVTRPGTVATVVCMGDTLTHLPGKQDVAALLEHVVQALAEGGQLVVTYRDLTRPLEGTDRFLPVRSTADRLLTCFLEYRDDDTVIVSDLLHVRSGDTWSLQASSYPKLRLHPDWLAGRCQAAGLRIRRNTTGPGGLQVLVATKG